MFNLRTKCTIGIKGTLFDFDSTFMEKGGKGVISIKESIVIKLNVNFFIKKFTVKLICYNSRNVE
jgi:hypothetical protein